MEGKKWIKPKSIELPIEKNPPIKTYLHHAFALSVLYTSDIYKLYYDANYIQIVYEPQTGCSYDFHEYHYKTLPYFFSDRLDDSMTKHMKSEINEFITMQIVNRYYCVAWVDAYYLPGELFYQKTHITHGVLIYKYDDEKKEYYALGYTNNNSSYGELIIPYDCFTSAYESEHFSLLDFIKINTGIRPLFEIEFIKEKLKAYLESKNYDFDDLKFHPKWKISCVGREACGKILDHIVERCENGEPLDLRWVYLFLEHKKSLGVTIEGLGAKWDENISSICEKTLLLSIKYNKCRDISLLKTISDNIRSVLNAEKPLILNAIK